MSGWTIILRNPNGTERKLRTLESKEPALTLARDLHRQHHAVDRIDGPDGEVMSGEEVLRWIKLNPE
jgi:hypothetical protein